MQIFNVGDKAINLYLLVSETHRLLVDAGFPGTIHHLGREMRKTGFRLSDIDYLMVTHFHVDHAGAVQELKDQGLRFILFDAQRDAIAPMETIIGGKWPYTHLRHQDNLGKRVEESRSFLKSIGFGGEVVATPGHTDDSLSLVLDSGECFTGDLYAESLLTEAETQQQESWNLLKSKGISQVFPGHGNPYWIQ
ncbi:MAG: MBL fold metallo-hydrolase [Bacteroidia bacterium]